MIIVVASFLCTDHDPITTATRFSAAEARALLLATQGASRVHAERWSRATLGGTGFRQDDGDTSGAGLYARVHALAGRSSSIAPRAGLGYWHETGTMGGEWRTTMQRAADERDAIVEIARHCREEHGLPVVAATDEICEWRETFEHSFRRRIAYALGFHASLRAGSLQCYEAWYEPLIVGTTAQLDGLASGCDDLDEFSLVLNLLARLHGTMAAEQHHGAPDPRAPGRVRAHRDKVAVLEARLESAARRLEARFNADGRIALRSLLLQLRSDRDQGIRHVDSPPIWGHAPLADEER